MEMLEASEEFHKGKACPFGSLKMMAMYGGLRSSSQPQNGNLAWNGAFWRIFNSVYKNQL